MERTRAIALDKAKINTMVKTLLLVALAAAAPFFLIQPVTGPLVNALLFIATVIIGIEGAVVVAIFPSVFALSVGLLPAVLAPMVPFIMIGNFILVLSFYYFKKKNYWLGVIVASVLKFLFLWLVSSLVAGLLLKKEVASTVSAVLSWPQLTTALSGGVIAYIFLKSFQKLKD